MIRAAYGPGWAAYGPQNPSDDNMRRHDVSENDIHVIPVPAGQRPFRAAHVKRPQQDSNLRSRLRRAILFKAPNCPDSLYLAICGDRSGTGLPSCSLSFPTEGCEGRGY